jgi:hypothetical protein
VKDIDKTFLVRLNPYLMESFENFFNRLGRENFSIYKSWYIRLIDAPRHLRLNYLSSQFCKSAAVLAGKNSEEVRILTVNRFLPHFYVSPRIVWEETGKNIYLGSSNKICPRCFADNKAYLIPWLLRPVTTCLFHGVYLIDVCPSCAKKLPTCMENTACPNCGKPIISKKADDPISEFYTRLIWSAIGCSNERHGDILQSFGFRLDLSSPHLMYLLFRISALLLEYDWIDVAKTYSKRGQRSTAFRLPIESRHRVLAAAAQLLQDWPQNWFAFLDNALSLENGSRGKTPKTQSIAHKLSKKFDKSEFSWLWDAFADYVNSRQHREGIRYWAHSIRKTTKPDQLQKIFLSLNFIEGPSIIPKKDKLLINLAKAAEILGITQASVRQLAVSGLIDRIQKSRRDKWMFYEDNIIDFQLGVLSKLHRANSHDEHISLKVAARKLAKLGISIVELLKALLEGELLGYVNLDGDSLQEIWFSPDDLERFEQRFLAEHSEYTWSIYKVMAYLGCDQRTLQCWARSGCLMPISDSLEDPVKYWDYSLQSVLDFQENMIDSAAAAGIIGCATRTLLAWVNQGVIRPASGRNVDGARTYRFNREGVITWRRDRMRSDEVKKYLSICQGTLENWVKKGRLKPIPEMGLHPFWFLREDIEVMYGKSKKVKEEG